MKKLYEKNELTFSLIWIVAYVVLFSVADNISLGLGTAKIITVPVCLLMTIFLAVWIAKNGLREKYGLCRIKGGCRRYLYFMPLAVIASTNLWRGVSLHLSIFETVLYIISMICVGFIEEVIFRGFLFQALCKENVKQAIAISSITFGIGHIVNLLNGAELIPTLLQICYAIAIGFLFTAIFYQSKSLVPCIVTHSLVNSLSAIAGESTEALNIITAIILTIVSISYALWLLSDRAKYGKS
ncbi:MAG: CPBP family intramembrane metalloprotease [Lachnospiraceae bacterium]|nr:CPBP family intramembrane metalloprotease [Lachnospiraceae bacterium]